MPDVKLFTEANAFAFKAHDGQRRNGALKLPYITHPLEVANILARAGFADDYELLAAAILHDVVEDCGVTLRELLDRFGPAVAGFVDQVSYPPGTTKAMKILTAPGLTRGPRLIKTADLISNINSLTEDPTAMTETNALRFVNYAQDFKRALGPVNPALDLAFENALLNFNLFYRPL